MTCADALEEAVKHYGGVVSNRQIFDYVKRKYPDNWKDGTIRAHVMGCSVNHSSSHHYKHFRKFLFTTGRSQVRLYDPETDGIWKRTPTGMVKTESGNEENEAIKKTDNEKPLQRSFTEELGNVTEVVRRLTVFQASWITQKDFQHHIDRMENYFSMYEEIWITGHFSNSFARKIQGLRRKLPGCDLRILSIDPKGNKNNLNALKKLKQDGAKVKIHGTLHARIFIGYNEKTSTWKTIIGSYDYNREGISGENINAGISSQDIEVVQKARDFFKEQWNSHDAREVG